MKRSICILSISVLLFSLVACAPSNQASTTTAPTNTLVITAAPVSTPSSEIIHFTDAYLEDAVRIAMNRPTGDITAAEAELVAVLDLSNQDWDSMNAEDGGIKDISDLKYFPNLTELHLDYNDLQDLTPLSTLTKINTLSFSAVRVNDLSPLATLTAMVNISFDWSYAPDQGFNGYETIDFVKDMKDLEIFEAKNAGIKDITPLASLPKLWSVFITDNQITDISPLAQIKTLKEFEIKNNPISDYSSLEPLHSVFPNLPAEFQPDVDLK